MKRSRLAAAFAAAAFLSSCAGPRPAEVLWRQDIEVGDRALRHGRLPEAETALSGALARAETFGVDDARLAFALDAMGDLRSAQGDPARAEPLYRRALAILEKSAGPDAPATTAALAYLAQACAAQGKQAEAARLLRRAVASAEKEPALRFAEAAARLSDLASIERSMDRLEQAEAAYRRALVGTMVERALLAAAA